MASQAKNDDSDKDGKEAAIIKLNQDVMDKVNKRLAADPALDLRKEFLSTWNTDSRILFPRLQPLKKNPLPKRGDLVQGNLSTLLAQEHEVRVVHPLSAEAESLIFGKDQGLNATTSPDNTLARCLHRLLDNSDILFEGAMGGAVVLKISDALVAKFCGLRETTEYSSLRYLAEHAPELPVPKPHGLIAWRSYQVALITYFPSMTLRDAWPSLDEENKMSIRAELSKIVMAWRSIPVKHGAQLGGIGGEGVKDYHGWAGDETTEVMTTAQQFVEWQFSYSHSMATTWKEFVRSVTPPVGPDEPIVLTHGDLWPANIMVDKDGDGKFYVTGIIDWEDSGFYPSYFELSRTLRNFGIGENDDWWRYVPSCLSPSSDPQRWLATRLWHQSCR